MNPEDHVLHVSDRFASRMRAKYRAGQAEHGGSLARKPVFPHAMAEIVDLAVYIETLSDQRDEAMSLLHLAQISKNWDLVREALNVLHIGNADGREEIELNPSAVEF